MFLCVCYETEINMLLLIPIWVGIMAHGTMAWNLKSSLKIALEYKNKSFSCFNFILNYFEN